MRAAFLAANQGKQVAILVPTTLLAQQHHENFKDRFAAWPFEIEVMSRFVSGKAQKYYRAHSRRKSRHSGRYPQTAFQ